MWHLAENNKFNNLCSIGERDLVPFKTRSRIWERNNNNNKITIITIKATGNRVQKKAKYDLRINLYYNPLYQTLCLYQKEVRFDILVSHLCYNLCSEFLGARARCKDKLKRFFCVSAKRPSWGWNFTNFANEDIRGKTSRCVTNSSIFDISTLIMINNARQNSLESFSNGFWADFYINKRYWSPVSYIAPIFFFCNVCNDSMLLWVGQFTMIVRIFRLSTIKLSKIFQITWYISAYKPSSTGHLLSSNKWKLLRHSSTMH